jgi:hypothetical protein
VEGRRRRRRRRREGRRGQRKGRRGAGRGAQIKTRGAMDRSPTLQNSKTRLVKIAGVTIVRRHKSDFVSKLMPSLWTIRTRVWYRFQNSSGFVVAPKLS